LNELILCEKPAVRRDTARLLGIQKEARKRDGYIVSLLAALKSPLPDSKTEGLYQSALARQRFDWLVGMNMSRAVTLRFRQKTNSSDTHSNHSIGRVKTSRLPRSSWSTTPTKRSGTLFHRNSSSLVSQSGPRMIKSSCPAAILWLGSEVAVNRWHGSRNSEDQFISEFGMDMVLKGAFPDEDRARTLKPEWGPMDLHVLHVRLKNS
jgi:hypothetical protein